MTCAANIPKKFHSNDNPQHHLGITGCNTDAAFRIAVRRAVDWHGDRTDLVTCKGSALKSNVERRWFLDLDSDEVTSPTPPLRTFQLESRQTHSDAFLIYDSVNRWSHNLVSVRETVLTLAVDPGLSMSQPDLRLCTRHWKSLFLQHGIATKLMPDATPLSPASSNPSLSA